MPPFPRPRWLAAGLLSGCIAANACAPGDGSSAQTPAADAGQSSPRSAGQRVEQRLALARLAAELGSAADAARTQKKRKYISTHTKEAHYREYLAGWSAAVRAAARAYAPELLLPAAARVEAVLSVWLRRDGTVEKIVVIRSTGHCALDEAAMTIVRRAAPFGPLPLEDQIESLVITRTFAFESADGASGTP